MIDMSAIAGMATSLRAAVEITKAMKDIHDANTLQIKVFELTREIISAQSSALEANVAQTTLLERVRDLEAQVASLEAWSREKERYQLSEVCPGVVAYTLKPEAQGSEALHWLCPTCYQRGQKRIMQSHEMAHGSVIWKCFECSGEIRVWRSVTPTKPAVLASIPSPSQAEDIKIVPGEKCPRCGELEYRVEKSVPHPIFGATHGKTLHQMKCKCGFTDTRSPTS